MNFNPTNPPSGRPTRALRLAQTLLLAALVMAPLSAHAVTQTKIFFVSDRETPNSIWTADADGANPAKLINNATNPAVSLDGTRLAFVQNGDIFIAKVGISAGAVFVTGLDNGAAPTALTTDSGNPLDDSPSFSLDGRRIIFERGSSADPDLFIINSDGTGLTSAFARTGAANSPRFVSETQIVFAARGSATATPPLDPSFSSLVSFVLGSATNSFVVQEAGSTSTNAVTRLTVSPLGTPVGRKVVFSRLGAPTRGLIQDNLDQTSASSFSSSLPGDNFPSFSPDGTKIVFSSTNTGATRGNGTGGASEIFLLNADNTGLTRLTNDAANDFAPVIGDITVQTPNAAPDFPASSYTAGLNDPLSIQLTATDPNGDTLTYTSANLPAGLSLSPVGLLTGTPAAIGNFLFQVTVNDGRGGVTTANIFIAVRNAARGTDTLGPVLTHNALPKSLTRADLADFTVTGTVRDVAPGTITPAGVRRVLVNLRTGDNKRAYDGSAFTTNLNRGYYIATQSESTADTTETLTYTRALAFVPTNLPAGAYILVLYPQDKAGNYSAEFLQFTVTAPPANTKSTDANSGGNS